MSYGPVGSLEEPEDKSGHSFFETGGISLWISREVLDSMEDPAMLLFNFGQFGWCEIRFVSD